MALNWIMAKGAVPIPGAKNQAQAIENAGALGWDLTAEELAELDRAALVRVGGIAGLKTRLWQHG
ncbi:MAG: aldo/keto reductase [Microthrixaceae bacterium]|nr:aldo/keto reductase [Microthrixaceae bacterium]